MSRHAKIFRVKPGLRYKERQIKSHPKMALVFFDCPQSQNGTLLNTLILKNTATRNKIASAAAIIEK